MKSKKLQSYPQGALRLLKHCVIGAPRRCCVCYSTPKHMENFLMPSEYLDFLVYKYLKHEKSKLDKHLKWYSDVKLAEAIIHASQAHMDISGRRHPHQRLLQHAAVGEIKTALQTLFSTGKKPTDFAQLYDSTSNAVKNVKGVGPLMIYDTALRLGAHFGVYPTTVFLQRGALVGARNFLSLVGNVGKSEKLKDGVSMLVNDFEPHLHELDAKGIENFLCIFARDLKDLAEYAAQKPPYPRSSAVTRTGPTAPFSLAR